MARLHTFSFELGNAIAEPWSPSAVPAWLGGTGTGCSTAQARGGAWSFRYNASAQQVRYQGAGGGANVERYQRYCVRFETVPASGGPFIFKQQDPRIQITNAKILELVLGSVRYSTPSPINLNQWYVLETYHYFNVAAGTEDRCTFRIDGVQVYSSAGTDLGVTASTNFDVGTLNTYAGLVYYVDDVAINDTTGADQNSWPGEGRVRILRPLADTAVGTNWVRGDGTSGSMFQAVDAVPPAGAAAGTSSNQVRNAVATASNLDIACESYTEAGISSGDEIVLAKGTVRVAASAITSTNTGTARLLSNPDEGATFAIDYEGSAAAVGTDPTGWRTYQGATVYNPSVTRGTRPVMRVTRTTDGSTRQHIVDLMGVLVEHRPPPTAPTGPTGTPILDDFNRADETPLSQGGNWGAGWLTSTVSMKLLSNKVGSNDTYWADAYRTDIPTSTTDQEVWATVDMGTSDEVGFVWRCTPGSANAYMGTIAPARTHLNIFKVTANVYSALQTSILFEPDVVTGDQVGIKSVGSTHEVWHRPQLTGVWYLAGSWSDSTFTTGTIGLYVSGNDSRANDFGGASLAAGGDDYDQPVNDTATVTDTLAKLARKGLTENASTATDSLTKVAAYVRALVEAPTTTDAFVKKPGKAIAETASTVTDSVALVRGTSKAIAEAASTATDALTKRATKGIAENASTGTDAISKAPKKAIAENASTATDAISKKPTKGIAENASTATDAITRKAITKGVTETASTVTDATSRIWAAKQTVADTAAGTDAITRKAVTKAQAEAPTVTDVIDVDLTVGSVGSTRSVPDTAAVTDAISKKPAKGIAESASTVTDASSRKPGKGIADTGAATDAVGKRITKTIAETASVADQATTSATGAYSRSASDTATVTDSFAKVVHYHLTFSEGLAATDATSKQARIARADTAAALDATSKKPGRVLGDSAMVADALSAQLNPLVEPISDLPSSMLLETRVRALSLETRSPALLALMDTDYMAEFALQTRNTTTTPQDAHAGEVDLETHTLNLTLEAKERELTLDG